MRVDATVLTGLARLAIESALAGDEATPPPIPGLDEPRAVFVTLRARDGGLRGCIGSIEARRPLGRAIIDASRGAAFRDGRFTPLTAAELPDVHIDVSVLSPTTPLQFSDEADAVEQLARTRPGVVFACGERCSVLLPQVWHQIRDPADFLRHLKRKAGLSPDFWSAEIELRVFTCEAFAEPASVP